MDLKKSPKADLNKSRGLFYQIGLTMSLLLVAGMFAWSQAEKKNIEKPDFGFAPPEVVLPPLAIPEQKPPEMAVQSISVDPQYLNIRDNSANISSDIDFTEWAEENVVVPPMVQRERVIIDDEIFIVVENMPEFQNGDLNEFRRWVMSKLVYPSIAAETGIQGKVTLSFVIEKDGTLTGIEVLSSPDRSLSDEAVRVLKMSPTWKPGMQRNTAVRVRFNMPVDFQLN